MNQVLHILQVGIVFLLMITVLVAAHELGHYLFARLFRMGIHEFAVGFGRPKLWTLHRSKRTLDDGTEMETEFNLRAWPLGGFVRIRGMEPQEDGSERNISNGFYSRPAWQRFVVLLAGPVFSVASGLALLAPLFYFNGIARATTRIDKVEDAYGAGLAGIKAQDVIASVDGVPITESAQVRSIVADRSGTVQVGVLRDGKPLDFAVTPKLDDKPSPVLDREGNPTGETRRQHRLGVQFGTRMEPVTVAAAVGESFKLTANMGANVAHIFTRPAEAKENVGGVITMARATDAMVNEGWKETIGLAAMLSISIGIFNLIPIPPLDGGQMLLAVIEMLRGGRRPSIRLQNALVTLGSVMLLTLFLGVFALDVSRLIEDRKPKVKPPVTAPAKKTAKPISAP